METYTNAGQLWQPEHTRTAEGPLNPTHARNGTDDGPGGDGDDDEDDDAQPELTRGQLLRIASGMLGLMFGWATKTVLTTPLFRDVYGVDPADLGFVWLAGPLSGLVVQPVVGVISDHREGQGQRSFFFAAGTIIMAASLALLPAAGVVCGRLAGSAGSGGGGGVDSDGGWGGNGNSTWARIQPPGGATSQDGNYDGNGVGLAVFSLWLLDLAMNASLVAIRAVVADCAPPRQQPEANTVIIISYGAGTLLGYGFGAVNAASWFSLPPGPFWKSGVDFWVAALVLLLTSMVATREAYRLERPRAPLAKQHREERPSWPSPSSPAYAVVSEGGTSAERQDRPHRHEAPQIGTRRKWAVLGDGGGGDDEDPDGGANGEVLRDEESMDGAAVLLQAATPSVKGKLLDMALFYAVPPWLLPVCLLLFFSWIGWFAIFIFGSDWVGVNVFGGDPSAASGSVQHNAYNGGVSWASVGLAAQAVVITVMGCGPVTLLVRFAGLKGAFLTAVVFQATCLLWAALLHPGPSGRASSFIIFAALGVPLALVESLPYMMVGMFSPREKHGQLLGKLNVWIVLAQLALTLCVHPIVEHSKDGDASVLLAGAIAAAAGALFVPAIRRAGEATEASPPPCLPSPSKAHGAGDESPSPPRRTLLDRE